MFKMPICCLLCQNSVIWFHKLTDTKTKIQKAFMVHSAGSATLTVLGPAVLMVPSSRWLFLYPDGMRQHRFPEVTCHQSHVGHGRHFTRLIGAGSADSKFQSILLGLGKSQQTLLCKTFGLF